MIESLSGRVDANGHVVTPPLTAHVCVSCPECSDDAKLQVTFLGRPGMPAGNTEPPRCGPGTIDLWADATGTLNSDAAIEVSDGGSAIRATFPADVFAPRTLSFPGQGNLRMCPGAPVTLDWSPASDLPAAPVTGDPGSLSFSAPYGFPCMECGSMGFSTLLTADASGVHFVVPTERTGGGASGTLTATLPNAAPQPALSCDGAAACTARPFLIASMVAARPDVCSP